MLAKIGDFLYRRRISALCIAMSAVIGATIFGLGLFGSLSSTALEVENSESSQATQLLQSKLGVTDADVIILFRSDTLSVNDAIFRQAATTMLFELNTHSEVASITDYYSTHSPELISQDGHETFALLRLKGLDNITKQDEYTSLKPVLTSPTLEVAAGGLIPANVALTEQATRDLQLAESVTLPILLLLLLMVFGGVIAASLPLLIGIISVLITFAILRGLTTVTSISIYATNVVTLLGLGLAINYSLFILSRFRKELGHNQQDVRAALVRTMATAGRTIIFSGLTVSISLLSLLLFPLNIMRSIGLGTISAVIIAMLTSLTLLPIMLALLGPRANALSLRRFIRSRRALRTSTNAREQQGMWYRLSELIMCRPISVTIISILILLILLIPLLHIKIATTDINLLPPESETRVVDQRLSRGFAHHGNAQLTIAITTPGDALSPENLASLDNYVKRIQAIPGVQHVQSLVTINPNINLATYQLLYAHPEFNPQIAQVVTYLANGDFTKITVTIRPADHTSEATTLVERIRALHVPGGLTALVSGTTPTEIDLLASMNELLPEAFLVVFASIFVLLFLMTGSLIMPLKVVILNMLSLSATFGGLVWIFQDGHLQDILHFQSLGSIDALQSVIIFALAFGLSMGCEVFVLSRIKERFDETGDNRLAVSSGIQSTGRLISSAALLMVVVGGGFGLARTLSVQEVGIGMVIAVIMDATLIRLLLLPATMRLLGTLNWWAPAPLRWLWERVGLKESTSTLVPAFHAQRNLESIAYGMRNEILSDKEDSTEDYAAPIESSPLHPVDGGQIALQPSNNVISTQIANGEEVMGPEMLLWCYPKKDVVNGSRLLVESNQFCILQMRGVICKVYEAGQHIVQTTDDLLLDLAQLTFSGEPVSLEYEALYINRARLVMQMSGVAISREMVEVDYSVDYAMHVATREDVIRFVQHVPYQAQAQGLCIEDINAYLGPVIKQTMNQLVQATPLGSLGSGLVPNQRLQMWDLSHLLRERLQQFLFTYGITVDEVNVQFAPRHESKKAALSLRDFGLSRLDTMHYFMPMTNNSANHHINEGQQEKERETYMIWQTRLDHYMDEMAVIQSELESARADFGQRMDALSARLRELSRVTSSDLRASIPANTVTMGAGLRGERYHPSNVETGQEPGNEVF